MVKQQAGNGSADFADFWTNTGPFWYMTLPEDTARLSTPHQDAAYLVSCMGYAYGAKWIARGLGYRMWQEMGVGYWQEVRDGC